MSSIIVWKVAGLFVRPKNMTRGLYKPQLVQKVVFHLLYLDIVETPPDIQFHEVLGPAELCNQLWN